MKGTLSLIVFIVTVIGFLLVKKWSPHIQKILPEQSIFFIEPSCSDDFKKMLKDSIGSQYKEFKDPGAVVHLVSQQFPVVSSVKVHICKTDKICFSVDLQKPLFVLGTQQVVCDNFSIVSVESFNARLVQQLPVITYERNCLSIDDRLVVRIVHFFKRLPSCVTSGFDMHMISLDEIILREKNRPNVSYVVSADDNVTLKKLAQCLEIQDAATSLVGAKKAYKKKNVTYDLRFKNQIVVR